MSETSKPSRSAIALAEERILAAWQKEKTFEKSVQQREGQPYFAFNDGPPFANGLPHFGHSLVTAVKDSMLRYKTMRGYYVPRRNGWDCHGLPVEYDVEREFGVSGKKQILELGLEKFNAACRESIFRYKDQWEGFLQRFGRWSDYENYYATVDTNYTESVWWVLKQIHEKGLLYRGFKSLPYCPRCETPLSNFELNEGYKDNVPDPSVFVAFPLTPESVEKLQQRLGLDAEQGTLYLLAWTTTPWTLPANAALAVDPKADYAYVKLATDDSTLILAKERLDVLDLRKRDYKLLKTVKGNQLVNLRYQPLYKPPQGKFTDEQLKQAWQVFASGAVDLADGTGILHVAPHYGEDDLQLGLAKDLPLIESVNGSGQLIFGPKNSLELFFKEADRHIIADLTRRNLIFAAETAEHTYPFCWRCETPLMYFATSTWFIAVTKIKEQLIKTADQINWVPAHIKTGRFGKWLEGARDWAVSRNRYWGAPMPIWQNVDDENDYIVVGSIEELKQLAGEENVMQALQDLHRPSIDEIVIKKGGKTYKRIEEVLDCWFESGSMPVAQWHYPFENKDLFAKSFPADFITEAIDQTRLWFYVQHVISTILFNQAAYKQVIVTGFFLAADGQKLSKRLHNYPPVEEVFKDEGADAWRLYMLSSTQATETADYMRFDRNGVRDMKRNVLDTLANSSHFFKTYSRIDNWSLDSARPSTNARGALSLSNGRDKKSELETPKSDNILDQWIISRLSQTIQSATKSADNYKIAHTILPVFELIDDLSNWYIRRSRRRFWKSENDADKQQAYATLHYALARISQILAPWAPFTSDQLWRELTQGQRLPESVHLTDWPLVDRSLDEGLKPDKASTKLLEDMKQVRGLIADGLAQRAEAKIKVRQPLAAAVVTSEIDQPRRFANIVAEELNVKEVKWHKGQPKIAVDTMLTAELKQEGIMREIVRQVQNARKKAGLNIEDRIHLRIESKSPHISQAVDRFRDIIFAETLVTAELKGKGSYSETAQVEGSQIKIFLQRAKKQ